MPMVAAPTTKNLDCPETLKNKFDYRAMWK